MTTADAEQSKEIKHKSKPTHYTMRHGVRVLKAHSIALKPYMFCVVDKRHEKKSIEADGQTFEVISPFTLADFDLTLQDYTAGASATRN